MLTSPYRDVEQRETVLAPRTAPVPSKFQFVIRIVAEHDGDQWQAFSLEFGLAAQADTFPEVKQKLESMIRSYLLDALEGEDREHAYELLTRKGTWKVYAKYYFCSVTSLLGNISGKSKEHIIYDKKLPMEPKFC
jgi:hypothetical protein